jgi:chromosome segregation ATPase
MARAEDVARSVATLDERVSGVRREIDNITAKASKTDEAVNGLQKELAVITERLTELKSKLEEESRRRWSVVPSLVGGVIGGALGFLGHVLVRLMFP